MLLVLVDSGVGGLLDAIAIPDSGVGGLLMLKFIQIFGNVRTIVCECNVIIFLKAFN